MQKIKVEWLDLYEAIIDEKIVDESSLEEIKRDLPRQIDDHKAIGIRWSIENKPAGVFWA